MLPESEADMVWLVAVLTVVRAALAQEALESVDVVPLPEPKLETGATVGEPLTTGRPDPAAASVGEPPEPEVTVGLGRLVPLFPADGLPIAEVTGGVPNDPPPDGAGRPVEVPGLPKPGAATDVADTLGPLELGRLPGAELAGAESEDPADGTADGSPDDTPGEIEGRETVIGRVLTLVTIDDSEPAGPLTVSTMVTAV